MTTRTPLADITDTTRDLPADERERLQADAARLGATHPDVLRRVAAPAAFEAAVARMVSDEPTLADIAAVLYVLGGNMVTVEVDPMRTQALCHLATRALGKFDAETRYAPPSQLAEVVRDARQSCGAAHLGCTEHVLSWIFDGTFCSPSCRADHMRSQGETWVD